MNGTILRIALKQIHRHSIYSRRFQVLAQAISLQLPKNAFVLDVGCGDGVVGSLVKKMRNDINIIGIDVLMRETCNIPVLLYDGIKIPYGDQKFDAVLLIDVLHHCKNPELVLSEAKRVSKSIIIKDHLMSNYLDHTLLSAMDWFGNFGYGVSLEYNYLSKMSWIDLFDKLELRSVFFASDLRLYNKILNWIFGNNLHFIARLESQS